ncbi:hypothetical protein ABQJ54_11145 [Rhodanobacter sp. Si-c]|uniref:DUF1330 domain-containing protein n=1 Tax=Rhodanobacter lycopersici TaxID=3162487 RepID=A0ABV3QER7_9GAMM
MAKATYFVTIIYKGREDDYAEYLGAGCSLAVDSVDPNAPGFVAAIRASNRREAMILAKREYPDYFVLDKIKKAS